MNSQPDKKLIRKRFARSLATYSDNAGVQGQIAGRLMTELTEIAGSEFARILEVGCGSGLFTRLIQEKLIFSELYLNDIVEECSYLADSIGGGSFIPGDIEAIDELPGELDLIVSNAVFQWLHNLPVTLNILADKLASGGLLAFSTFGPENFAEIRALTGATLDYYSLAGLKTILSERFELVSAQEKSYFLEFASPEAVLKHMKKTGVTAVAGQSWTRSNLREFSTKYTQLFSNEKGVVLTYQPIIIVATRR